MKLKRLLSQKVLNSLFAFLLLFSTVSPLLGLGRVKAQELEIPEAIQDAIVDGNQAAQEENADLEAADENAVSEEDQETDAVVEEEETGETLSTTVEPQKVTYGGIQKDVSYVYPDNEAVSIKFLTLPDGVHSLTIAEVQTEFGTGYNFTSDMTNGTFIYNLHLPNLLNKEEIKVEYSENGVDYQVVENVKTVDPEEIVLYGLNHFTIFVITDDEAVYEADETHPDPDYTEQNDRGSSDDPTFGIHYPNFDAADKTITWNASSAAGFFDGKYGVYVSWTVNPNRTQEAYYRVNYNGGFMDIGPVNQELLADGNSGANGDFSGWYFLGVYDLDHSSNVVLFTKENSSNSEYVIADEVKLVGIPADPVMLGWNVQSLSSLGDIPPYLTCLGGDVYYNLPNNTSSTWSPVAGTNVRYIRHNIRPDGSQILLSGSQVVAVSDPDDLAYIAANLSGSYANYYTPWGYFGMGEGLYQTRVRAFEDDNLNGDYDLGEPISEWSNSCNIVLDTLAPVVDLTSHNNGDVINGVVNVEGTVTDDNNHHYWFVIQNSSGQTVAGPGVVNDTDPSINVSLIWDTTLVPNGTYTIKLEARDKAGNKDAGSVEWVSVEVNNVGSFQGRKYEDSNNNGVHDDNTTEPRLNGWTINLYNDAWGYLDSSVTGAGALAIGQFRFENLPFGTYYACEYLGDHAGWFQSGPVLGTHPVDFGGSQMNDAVAVENGSGNVNEGAVCWQFTIDQPDESYGWVKFGNYHDTQAPTIDTIPDQEFDEGKIVNFGILDGKGMYDNVQLDMAYVTITYTDLIGTTYTEYETFDASEAGGDGKGGTLNELYEYYMGSLITFGDYDLPVDTSFVPEGVFTFDYYVTDMAGNRSDCNSELAGDQNCVFSVTINNVAPKIDEFLVEGSSSVTIVEGDSVGFTGSFGDPSFIDLDDDGISDNFAGYPDDAPWWPEIDYGDGTVISLSQMADPGVIPSIPSHVYAKEGVYTATLTVCEDQIDLPAQTDLSLIKANGTVGMGEGECGSATVKITVNNFAPTVGISATPGTSTTEQAITLTANPAGGNNPVTVTNWNCNFTVANPTALSVTTPAAPGTYTCVVTVQDVDGDTATAIKSVTVNAAQENGTTATGTTTGATGQVLGEGDAVGTDELVDLEDNEVEGEVLGEMVCDETTKASGFVYYDKNGNGEKDEDENGLGDVKIEFYSEIDGEKRLVLSVRTDENGYWEADVCPGSYDIEIDKDSLPEDTEIKGDDVLGINVNQGEELNNVNFTLKESGGGISGYWWVLLLLCLGILALGSGSMFIASRRNER
ncbi:hypothetical protein JW978_04375 [Candidatus Dojkabacteria bacterium]|nr:hypothetical protein [Candidatus Dojkabacteria bacterium]